MNEKEKTEIVNLATVEISQGKPNAYGIVKKMQNGGMLRLLGERGGLNIIDFCLEFRNASQNLRFNLNSFDGVFMFGKSAKEYDPWYVLTDKDFKYIASSVDEMTFLHVIAFAAPKDSGEIMSGQEGMCKYMVPGAMNILFDNTQPNQEIRSTCVVTERSIAELWEYELRKMKMTCCLPNENTVR